MERRNDYWTRNWGNVLPTSYFQLTRSLADPVKQYPKLFGQSVFFRKFRYVLPNLVTALLLSFSWVLAFLFLKETLESKKGRLDCGLRLRRRVKRCCGGIRRHVNFPKKLRDQESDRRRDSEEQLLSNTNEPQRNVTSDAPITSPETSLSILDALTPQIIINICVYSGLSLHSIAFDELFPIFCATKIEDGGLGMSSDQIGTALSITGIFALLFNITVFPIIYNKLGAIPSLRISSALFILVYFVFLLHILQPANVVCSLPSSSLSI